MKRADNPSSLSASSKPLSQNRPNFYKDSPKEDTRLSSPGDDEFEENNFSDDLQD